MPATSGASWVDRMVTTAGLVRSTRSAIAPGSVVSAPATGVQASQAPVAAAIAVAVTGAGFRNVAMRVMKSEPLVFLHTPSSGRRQQDRMPI